jgi:hypothetical protein
MLGLFEAKLNPGVSAGHAWPPKQIRQLASELSRPHDSGHAIHHTGSLVLALPWVASAVKGIVHEPADEARPGKGRPPSIDTARMRKIKAQGIRAATEIAKALGIGRASVCRVLEACQ